VEPADRVRYIHYPPGREVKLAFSSVPLNLYTDTVVTAMNEVESRCIRAGSDFGTDTAMQGYDLPCAGTPVCLVATLAWAGWD